MRESSLMASPPVPALGALRVACPADVLRVGIVAAAGFAYSPLFRWERPHHQDFPEDTLLSYRSQFRDAIESDDIIVLVAEDSYDPSENESTKAIIPSGNGWNAPEKGEKVIVGVVSIELEPSSSRKGQVQCHKGEYPNLPHNLGRDLNKTYCDSFGEKEGAAKQEHCSGFAFMDMLVVHPAYWKRGHGTQLVQWGIKLSETDGVVHGVDAAGMGKKLYLSLGFTWICEIKVSGDSDDPQGVSTDLCKYDPGAQAAKTGQEL